MFSFINTECKSDRQSSNTSFKHNVGKAESESEFRLKIGAGGKHSGETVNKADRIKVGRRRRFRVQ